MDVERREQAAVVRLRGAADVAGVDQLRQQLLDLVAAEPASIVLDLGELEFIGSAALGAVVLAHIRCRTIQTEIRLVSPQASVQRTLAVTRLTKLFEIFETVDAAISA